MTLLAIWLIGVAVVLVVNLYLNGRKWDEFWQWGKDQDDAYWNFTWALVAPTYGMWSFGRYLKGRSQRDRSSQIETRQFKKSIASV